MLSSLFTAWVVDLCKQYHFVNSCSVSLLDTVDTNGYSSMCITHKPEDVLLCKDCSMQEYIMVFSSILKRWLPVLYLLHIDYG